MKIPTWFLLAVSVPVCWGVWGGLTEIPEKWIVPPFPPTLGYAVWSLTMLPFAIFALNKVGWKLELTLHIRKTGSTNGKYTLTASLSYPELGEIDRRTLIIEVPIPAK